MVIRCNQCFTEVETFEVESDDPEVGWCSRFCQETDAEEPWMEIRELFDEARRDGL